MLLFVAKTLYLFGENEVNSILIDLAAEPTLEATKINDLRDDLQLLSAFGFALLLFPLFYTLLRRWIKDIAIFATIFIFSLTTAFGLMYFSIDKIVDHFVSKHEDKYYSAYQLSLVRYALINDVTTFKGFINKESISEYDVADKALLLNLSLLALFSGEDTVSKISNEIKKDVVAVFFNHEGTQGYASLQAAINKAAKKIESGWNNYTEGLKKANRDYKEKTKREHISKEYEALLKDLEDAGQVAFKDYKKKVREYHKRLSQKLKQAPALTQEMQRNFYDRFDPKYWERYQKQFRKKSLDYFNREVEFWEFCVGGNPYINIYTRINCGNEYNVKSFIESEAEKAWEARSDLPLDIESYDDFMSHKSVRELVEKKRNKMLLEKLGITFEKLSTKTFAEKYRKIVTKKIEQGARELLPPEFKNRKFDSLKFRDFVYSEKIRSSLRSAGVQKDDIGTILRMIEKRDLSGFKSFYTDKLMKSIDDKIERFGSCFANYSECKNTKTKEIVKTVFVSIFVTPYMLAITLGLSMLNVIALSVMLVQLVLNMALRNKPENRAIALIIGFSYYAIIFGALSYALLVPNQAFLDKNRYVASLINNESGNGKYYLNLLSWVVVLEEKSYARNRWVKQNLSSEYKKPEFRISKHAGNVVVKVNACNLRTSKGTIITIVKKNSKYQYIKKVGDRYQVGADSFLHESCVDEKK